MWKLPCHMVISDWLTVIEQNRITDTPCLSIIIRYHHDPTHHWHTIFHPCSWMKIYFSSCRASLRIHSCILILGLISATIWLMVKWSCYETRSPSLLLPCTCWINYTASLLQYGPFFNVLGNLSVLESGHFIRGQMWWILIGIIQSNKCIHL